MIPKEEVKHIAHLARLALSEKEIESLGADLGKILEFVKKLGEVDTNNIAPLNGGTDLINQMRDDVKTPEHETISNPETVAELVNAAPAKEKGYVKVKSVF
jgi:aspartyl-tRNA(Asn)/glutamyl-tRNA(Gln) amidotransferase subunit C